MNNLGRKTECCGSRFETDRVSLLGLVTFSVPAAWLSGMLLPLLWPATLCSSSAARLTRTIQVIFRANLKLIKKQSIFPGTRCALSAKLLGVLPRASGFLYEHFNFLVISLAWLSLLVGVALIV
jgi:hypothetical protein